MVNDQIERLFVVSSIAPAGIRAHQLRHGQIGLFDTDTNLTVDTPAKCKGPVVLKWKSLHTGNREGYFKDMADLGKPHETLPITSIDTALTLDQATDEVKVFEAYLGYDGVNECKNLSFSCGSTYILKIHAKGKPIRDQFGGHDRTFSVYFQTDCCEDCSVDEAVTKTLQKIVKAVETQGDMKWLARFFDIDPIVSCCPTPAPFPKVDFFDFCMSVCDTGDVQALADVQAQYPGYEVYREKRDGATSHYRVDCVLTSPAAFVQSGHILADCGTCPAGYTPVAAQKKYIVTIDNAGVGTTPAQWLAEVQAAGAFSVATSAIRLSRNGSVSVYEVIVPGTFVEPTTPIAETDFSFIADIPASCVQTAPVSIAWTQCGERYKITRKLCLTLKNGDCGAPAADLAEMQAFYASIPNVVPGSVIQTAAGDCLSTYTVEQYSDCLQDGCDEVGIYHAKFPAVPPYKGVAWGTCECEGWTFDVDGCPVPPAATIENCRGGLKFKGKKVEIDSTECEFSLLEGYETEGIELVVGIAKVEGAGDFTTCDWEQYPWTVTQMPKGPVGLGIKYLPMEVRSAQYEKVPFYDSTYQGVISGLTQNRVQGINWAVKQNKLYNGVIFYHSSDKVRRLTKMDHATREAVMLLVPAEKTDLLASIKTLVNGIIAVKGDGCSYL